MAAKVTRRRFMLQTVGMIGRTMLAGDLLPLLAEAAKRKQVLRVAIERDFETLRPELSAGDTINMLRRLIYTTPIHRGTKQRPDGSLIYDPDTVEPVLANSYKLSEDRQLIEFTLRSNAKFANGDPINAQALKDSYAWFLTTRGAGQLRVNGLPSADRIEVVDDVTVRLNLDRPVAWGLIGNALLSSSSIVHAKEILKHATAEDPYGLKCLETKAVESGAFVIETWQKGSMMSLVPNPHAFQPAKLERIILHVIPDASTRRIILERGDVDFAVQLATKDIPDLRKVPAIKVTSYPSARGWWPCERAWFGWYCSGTMEQLRAEWARTEDPAKRKELVEEIQRLAYDEVPYVPLGQWTQRRAYRRHVKGVVPVAAPILWNVWLDKQ